jgi:hypothetical protein
MRALSRLLLGLLLIVIVAWVGLWWYAEGRIQDGINEWATRTATSGQVRVSYDSMARGGSPLAATVTVHNMRLVVAPTQAVAPITLTIPVVTFEIDAATPTVLTVNTGNQLSVSGTRGDVAVTYDAASLIEHLNGQALFKKTAYAVTSSELKSSNINVLASSGSLQVLHIDDIDAQGAYNPTATASQSALTLSEFFQGLSLSPLVTRLAGLPFDGRIAELALTLNVAGPVPPSWLGLQTQLKTTPAADTAARQKLLITALHDWAAGGGTATSTAKLVLGPSTLTANANIKFDANVQPIAAGDVLANHLDAFTQAIANAYPQLQPQIAQFEALMSPYLTTNGDDGQVLTLHLTAANGNFGVNGKTLAPMPPLDWNSLENPPPPVDVPDNGGAPPGQ